jgi:beta-lactam-binding protein with PASTA domain
MEDSKWTDEKGVSIKLKVAISVAISLMVLSNTITVWVKNVEQNTIDIAYEEERTKRRIANAAKEQDYKIEIKDLKRDLRDCENK